jgi:hypothetical protein
LWFIISLIIFVLIFVFCILFVIKILFLLCLRNLCSLSPRPNGATAVSFQQQLSVQELICSLRNTTFQIFKKPHFNKQCLPLMKILIKWRSPLNHTNRFQRVKRAITWRTRIQMDFRCPTVPLFIWM